MTRTRTLYPNPVRHYALPPPTPTADIPPGARRTPLHIGLQLHATPHSTADTSAFDPQIMHRPLSPTLSDVTTTVDASIPDLAAAFNVPTAVVASHWLTSRSPMELPGYDRRIDRPASSRPRFVPVSPNLVQAYRQLATDLAQKLEHYIATTEHLDHNHDDHLEPARHDQSVPLHTCPRVSTNKRNAAEKRRALANQRRNLTATRPECGFSKLSTHAQLALASNRRTVRKEGRGLYRAALGVGVAKGAYAEFEVVCLGGEGGLAVGAAPARHVLNRLAGSDGASAGLHASGMIVTGSGEWKRVCAHLNVGDVVGVAVGKMVEFFVNGRFVGEVAVETEGLRFVACLYHYGAEVNLRCCEDEWEYFDEVVKRTGKRLHASCTGVEDVEADMSSTSTASASNDAIWKIEPSPLANAGVVASCESVVTP